MSFSMYPIADEARLLYQEPSTTYKYRTLLAERLDTEWSHHESESAGDTEHVDGYNQLFTFHYSREYQKDQLCTWAVILRTDNDGFVYIRATYYNWSDARTAWSQYIASLEEQSNDDTSE